MSNKYNLTDYLMSIEICRDLPKVREVLVKMVDSLTPFKKYKDAAQVINQAEDAIIMIDLQLGVYSRVKNLRGKSE